MDARRIRTSSQGFRSHKIFADSRQIRGFAMDSQIRDGVRGFAQIRDSSRKSSTRFAPIRDGFAIDSRICAHDSHKFARIRDGYHTVLRVKCVSPLGHVTRAHGGFNPNTL
eukprot:1332401-Prymnesium_polylepis.1